MYRQWDGMPETHGRELLDFIKGFELVSGYSTAHEEDPNLKFANGVGCFAAQLLTHFKSAVAKRRKADYSSTSNEAIEYEGTQIGNIYLMPTSEARNREEYTYEVIYKETEKNCEKTPFLFTVYNWDGKMVSRLTFDQFEAFIIDEERKIDLELEEWEKEQAQRVAALA